MTCKPDRGETEEHSIGVWSPNRTLRRVQQDGRWDRVDLGTTTPGDQWFKAFFAIVFI